MELNIYCDLSLLYYIVRATIYYCTKDSLWGWHKFWGRFKYEIYLICLSENNQRNFFIFNRLKRNSFTYLILFISGEKSLFLKFRYKYLPIYIICLVTKY